MVRSTSFSLLIVEGDKLSISGISIGTVEAFEIEHHDILEGVAEEDEECEEEIFSNENELALTAL